MFKKFIKDDFYGQGFWLFVGNNKEVNSFLSKKYEFDEDAIPSSCVGYRCTIENDELGVNAYVIYLEEFNFGISSYSVLSHEVFHHVSRVMYDLGVKYIEDDGNEAFAYYTGYVTKKIMEALMKMSNNNKPPKKKKKLIK